MNLHEVNMSSTSTISNPADYPTSHARPCLSTSNKILLAPLVAEAVNRISLKVLHASTVRDLLDRGYDMEAVYALLESHQYFFQVQRDWIKSRVLHCLYEHVKLCKDVDEFEAFMSGKNSLRTKSPPRGQPTESTGDEHTPQKREVEDTFVVEASESDLSSSDGTYTPASVRTKHQHAQSPLSTTDRMILDRDL